MRIGKTEGDDYLNKIKDLGDVTLCLGKRVGRQTRSLHDRFQVYPRQGHVRSILQVFSCATSLAE
jgi:hypothetical protein